ncbi:MAG TPA: MFS transporter [Pyrinomonadaceae bacterium]|nr:MFS transporter [Pyrinomonadaceae bacterium]
MKSPGLTNKSMRKVAIASFIGTTIEWYDFFIYGQMAGSDIFARLFFPKLQPAPAMLAAFGTYAVGFAARPIGGAVCGHLGDRFGRKSTLVLTLLLVGISTVMIGFLPTYDSIGIWAPVLLITLRLVQGFGVGGEWGGAVLLSVENAPSNRRGFYGSWPQVGVPAGLFLSSGVFWLITKLPASALFSWGWRVGFLASAVLVVVGLYIRLSIDEPLEFSQIRETRTESRRPILDAVVQYPKNLMLATGAKLAENAVFYLYTVFIITFATQRVAFSKSAVLAAISLAAVVGLVTVPVCGFLSDVIGRKPIYLAGAIFSAVFAFPSFWLVETGRTGLMTLAIVLALGLGWAAMYGPQAGFFSELFGTRVRYSGASLGYQLAAAIAGGLSLFLAAGVLFRTGKSWPIALFIVALAAVTILSVLYTAETAHKDISQV